MRRGPPEDIFDEPGVDAEGRPVVVRELAAGRAFVEPFLDGASGGGAAGSTAGSAVTLEGPKLRDALPKEDLFGGPAPVPLVYGAPSPGRVSSAADANLGGLLQRALSAGAPTGLHGAEHKQVNDDFMTRAARVRDSSQCARCANGAPEAPAPKCDKYPNCDSLVLCKQCAAALNDCCSSRDALAESFHTSYCSACRV